MILKVIQDMMFLIRYDGCVAGALNVDICWRWQDWRWEGELLTSWQPIFSSQHSLSSSQVYNIFSATLIFPRTTVIQQYCWVSRNSFNHNCLYFHGSMVCIILICRLSLKWIIIWHFLIKEVFADSKG